MKKGILNYTKSELIELVSEKNIEKFRVEQIFIWIYRFGKTSFLDMTNLNKNLRNILDNEFYIYRPKIANVAKSVDGTIKFLLELDDKKTIETVFIPEFNDDSIGEKNLKRTTICVSSQIGCAVGCKFCNTGYGGFCRNLTTEEIIGQFLIVKDYLKFWENPDRLSNIVFMGMGEPLFNYENVLKAIDNIIADEMEGVSRRKITISTSGISSILSKISQNICCKLAISLHAPNNEIRSKIMPINNTFNIESIINACIEYSKYHEYLKITFEYLLLRGVNDSENCAIELAKLFRNLNAKVNLLQFNPWPGCDFIPSTEATVAQFQHALEKSGINVTLRKRRGEDIMAACGQLNSIIKI
ncbi:dual-specificity RNA methyltransferase RlmN [Alphaproteobacteria bacterium]|nr:dual-specificity RNA methyltransferase RlmN [Alphaproteobacteria bacterium]